MESGYFVGIDPPAELIPVPSSAFAVVGHVLIDQVMAPALLQ